MTDTPVTILTMKWGTLYGAREVNNLYRGVARHLSIPHRFVCFTDDTTGIDPGVVTYPLPELKLAQGQTDTRWRKLTLFSKDLFGLSGPALFLDLDLVITGPLDPFFDNTDGAVTMIRDDTLFRPKPLRRINPERDAFLASVGNSSVFHYEIGAHSYVLDNYVADPEDAMRRYEISQQFQSAQLAAKGNLKYWPDGWCVSFKNHCVPRNFASYFADPSLPDGARIVVFAGSPKMSDALYGKGGTWYRRIGNVDWLRKAWEG
ncbi:MAG: hypothetical protein OIF47_16660 [Marinibacterium sp.]|nr:hypothetical protein [Marinibacterium sp.]